MHPGCTCALVSLLLHNANATADVVRGWGSDYDGPHDVVRGWGGYDGPHESRGAFSALMDSSTIFLDPLMSGGNSLFTDYDAVLVGDVPIAMFHELFEESYKPAAPGCVRRSVSRPLPTCTALPSRAPASVPARPTAMYPLIAAGANCRRELLLRRSLDDARGGRDSSQAALHTNAVRHWLAEDLP